MLSPGLGTSLVSWSTRPSTVGLPLSALMREAGGQGTYTFEDVPIGTYSGITPSLRLLRMTQKKVERRK